jgi:NlpC/P60 family putative phage cell wall peptidase
LDGFRAAQFGPQQRGIAPVRPEIVAAARGWIGTPYVHQQSVRGAGCDCLGLLRGVWREVAGAEPEAVPAYSMDWSEPQGDEVLWRAALRHLTPKLLRDAASGDVLLFRMREGAVAKHVGLQAEGASFIHAYSGHGVVESALSQPWRRRIVARFAFPKGDL